MRIRNAEWGMRNEKKCRFIAGLLFRNPNSEFRILAILSLDCESYPNSPCQDKMES
jgi:hypothetical protein